MMIRNSSLLAGLAFLLVLAAPARAQVSAELRGGAAIGNHVPSAAGLETIPGLSVTGAVEYRAAALASVYASFSRAAFGCEEGFCTERDVRITTTGFGAGVRLHPRELPWPWVRAGVLLYDAAIDTNDRPGSVPYSPGLELGAGVSVPVAERVSLSPGVYFRTQAGDDRTTLLGADVGVHVSLFD